MGRKGVDTFSVDDVKQIPKIKLPEGYSVRPAKSKGDRTMCDRDQSAWKHIQRVHLSSHSLSNRLSITKADGVIFAEYKGEIIGCVCVLMSSNKLARFEHGIVLRKHRRVGVYKAMMALCLQYCIDRNVKWIFLRPPEFSLDFWRRVGFFRRNKKNG